MLRDEPTARRPVSKTGGNGVRLPASLLDRKVLATGQRARALRPATGLMLLNSTAEHVTRRDANPSHCGAVKDRPATPGDCLYPARAVALNLAAGTCSHRAPVASHVTCGGTRSRHGPACTDLAHNQATGRSPLLERELTEVQRHVDGALAQSGSAFAWHARGRGFKSPRLHASEDAGSSPALPYGGGSSTGRASLIRSGLTAGGTLHGPAVAQSQGHPDSAQALTTGLGVATGTALRSARTGRASRQRLGRISRGKRR